MKPLHPVPSVVGALLDQVDLLPRSLSDVSRPQLTAFPVEAETPGYTQAVCPDLFTPILTVANERIVRRDTVLEACRANVHVDAQNRTQPGSGILSVPEFVPSSSPVSETDIEHSIRPEGELTSVVIRRRLRHLPQNAFAFYISDIRIARHAEFG